LVDNGIGEYEMKEEKIVDLENMSFDQWMTS